MFSLNSLAQVHHLGDHLPACLSVQKIYWTKGTPESDKEVAPLHTGDCPEAQTESQRLKASLI